MNPNTQKYISFIVIILAIIVGVFLFKGKSVNAPAGGVEMSDNTIVKTPDTAVPEKPVKDSPSQSTLTALQKDLLVKLQKTVDARDYEAFAVVLEQVYKNQWGEKEEFKKAESDFYVYTTDKYWVKGDLANALKFSTIVYNKVPEAWRFRYLRIVTLEKYGRNAFDVGDLKTAEDYANQILQMMFRPEGANLIADVYISKIKTNIKDGNINLAKQNLGFIWDYEVSTDRRVTLEDLKKQLGE